jgi:copper chaperone
MNIVLYSVPAIHCAHCTHTIEMEVGELAGVKSVRAQLDTKQVTISFEAPANEEQIKSLLAGIEYPVAS